MQEFQVIQLPSNLQKGPVYRRAHQFPDRRGFCSLAKKKVRELSGTVIWLEMNEMDILQTSSAIIDAYLQGARLYALPYIEPGLQEAAVVNYPANPKVLDLMAHRSESARKSDNRACPPASPDAGWQSEGDERVGQTARNQRQRNGSAATAKRTDCHAVKAMPCRKRHHMPQPSGSNGHGRSRTAGRLSRCPLLPFRQRRMKISRKRLRNQRHQRQLRRRESLPSTG